MHYLTLKMTFRAEDETVFPLNPANTFRGAMGYALKSISCVHQNAFANKYICNLCDKASRCPYAICYETSRFHLDLKALANFKSFEIPHLFNVDCGFSGNSVFKPGERYCFGVRLFGAAVSVAPYLIVAAKKAAENGFRDSLSVLESITDDEGNSVWNQHEDRIFMPEPKTLYVQEPIWDNTEKCEIKLNFVTPVAFKDSKTGGISKEPDFCRIIGSLMRRYTAFEATEGRILDWHFQEISELASKVVISGMNIEPVYWERYSTRQLQRMSIVGIIGEVKYVGPTAAFVEILNAGEIIHCGRSISFGQGRICVTQIRHLSNRDEFKGFLDK